MKCTVVKELYMPYYNASKETKTMRLHENDRLPLVISYAQKDYLVVRDAFNDAVKNGSVRVEKVQFTIDGRPISHGVEKRRQEADDAFRQLFYVPCVFDDLEYYVSQAEYVYQVGQEQVDQFLLMIERSVY